MPTGQTITLSMPEQQVVRYFNRLPQAVQTGVIRGVRRAFLAIEDQVRRRANLSWRRGGAGLSGRLTSYARVGGGSLGLDAAIGFRKPRGFPYELSQEFGAKAKAGKAMAIPLDATARQLSDRGEGPRQYPGRLVMIKTPRNVLLFPMGKRNLRQAPAYVLVKSIPPRLHFMQNVIGNKHLIEQGIRDGFAEGKAAAAARGNSM